MLISGILISSSANVQIVIELAKFLCQKLALPIVVEREEDSKIRLSGYIPSYFSSRKMTQRTTGAPMTGVMTLMGITPPSPGKVLIRLQARANEAPVSKVAGNKVR